MKCFPGFFFSAGGVAVGEAHAVGAQFVEVRRVDEIAAATSQGAFAEVVDEQENEVRFVGCTGRKCEQDREDEVFHGSSLAEIIGFAWLVRRQLTGERANSLADRSRIRY